MNREVVARLYAAAAFMTRIHTLVDKASELQAASEGDTIPPGPAEATRDSELAALLNAQEAALCEALDRFPYHTDNETAISKLNRACMLIGTAVELIERGAKIAEEPAETYDSLKETVAGNIRRLAAQQDDPKVREDAERIAGEIEQEGKPEASEQQFDDKHCILLRGIIRTANDVFREVNEPMPGYGINDPAVEASCALFVLVEQLERVMAGDA